MTASSLSIIDQSFLSGLIGRNQVSFVSFFQHDHWQFAD